MLQLDRYRDVSPFVAELPGPELRFLEGTGEPVSYYTGETLCTAGSPADAFYLLTNGRVTIETRSSSGDRVTVGALGTGDLVGVSWFFPPYRWRWDVRAATDVTAIAFNAEKVRDEAALDDRLRMILLERFTEEMDHRLESARHLFAERF